MHEAQMLNERGLEASRGGDSDAAVEAFLRAAEAAPDWSVPRYNLGREYKYRGQWELSAKYNREAVELDGSDEAAWWNLGIAATALGDWATARSAWARCGIELPGDEGPIEADFGLTPVRLDPGGRGEVVWCRRIDPARAVVRSVPLPESGHRYGDLLLHDGAANGYRALGDREVPVFDALARLGASAYETFVLDLPESDEAQRALLLEVADELGGAAEDWSESIRFICRSCSEGRPHERHDAELGDARPDLAVAVAARSPDEVERILDTWRERSGFSGYAGFVSGEG